MRADSNNRPDGAQQYVVTLAKSGESLADILRGDSDVTILDLTKSAALVSMSEQTRERLSRNAKLVIEADLSYDLV